MAKKKLSTEEILKAARAQASQQGAASEQDGDPQVQDGADAAASSGGPAPAKPAEESAKKPAVKPKSTADILAAARAQAGKSPAGGVPAKKPGSTADILAAARAQAGSGGGQPAAAKSSGAKSAAAKSSGAGAAAVAARPSGEKPSVQEMLRAVREGRKPEEVQAVAKPAASAKPDVVIPQKPVPAAKKSSGEKVTRRSVLRLFLLTPFSLAWVSLGAACSAALLGMARFMFPNVLVEPPMKFKIGPPSDYPFGTVSTKWKAARGVWIVHTDRYQGRNLITALISVCTHLGCTPNWLDGEQKFKCPCHGSGFYIDGINFEGPAPRPLERAGIRLAEDGMLEVDKSLKFQQEMGQWEDPASCVEIV